MYAQMAIPRNVDISPAPGPVDQRSKQRSNQCQISQSSQVRSGHFARESCKGMENAFFKRPAPGQCSLLWDSSQMEDRKRKQINKVGMGYISEERRAEQKVEVVGCHVVILA